MKKKSKKANWKTFLNPTISKVILTVIVIFYLVYHTFLVSAWGHLISPLPHLLLFPLYPLGIVTSILPLILLIPYSYLIACVLIPLLNFIKKEKVFLILAILILIILLGIDEPLINNTINKPNYSCFTDSDCTSKIFGKGGCGIYKCLNKNWEYYDSIINSVLSLSCRTPLIVCSCDGNTCVTKNLYETPDFDIEDCEKVDQDYMRLICFHILAEKSNDPSICDRIEEKSWKEDCIAQFEYLATSTTIVTTTTTIPSYIQTCAETDGGRDYYKKGEVQNMCPGSTTTICEIWVDQCLDESTLLEYYCFNPDGEQYSCPNGCVDGACLPVI